MILFKSVRKENKDFRKRFDKKGNIMEQENGSQSEIY